MPTQRQTLLFSATYPDGIGEAGGRSSSKFQRVTVQAQHEHDKIRQRFYEITDAERLDTVSKLLRHYRPVSTLAFCNTAALP